MSSTPSTTTNLTLGRTAYLTLQKYANELANPDLTAADRAQITSDLETAEKLYAGIDHVDISVIENAFKPIQTNALVGQMQTTISALSDPNLTSDQANPLINQLKKEETQYATFTGTKLSDVPNQISTLQQLIQNAPAKLAQILKDINTPLSAQIVASINNLMKDIILHINNIMQDQEKIDADKAQEEVYKAKISEDISKMIGLGILNVGALAYYADQLASDRDTLDNIEDDESNYKTLMSQEQAALSVDLESLSIANDQDLQGAIQSLVSTLAQALKIASSGDNSEAAYQQMSTFVSQAMGMIQMIIAKIQQIQSQNKTIQDQTTAAQQQIAVNKAQVTTKASAEIQSISSDAQKWMQAAKIEADVGAVTMAIASGGSLAMVSAAIIVFMNENPWFNFTDATNKLADKMDSNDSAWSHLLAAIIVAVIVTVATCGVAGVADAAGTAIAEGVESSVGESVANAVDSSLAADGASASSGAAASGGSSAAGGAAASSANSAEESAKASFRQTLAKALANSFKNGGGPMLAAEANTNTYTYLFDTIASLAEGDQNKSMDELQKKKLYQILGYVGMAVQIIMGMVGSMQTASASTGSSVSDMIASKLTVIMKAATALMAVSNFMQAAGSAMAATTDDGNANLKYIQADSDKTSVILKHQTQTEQQIAQQQSGLDNDEIQNLMAATQMLVRKSSEAEQEAAKVLTASAG